MPDEKCLECPVRGSCCFLEANVGNNIRVIMNDACQYLNVNTGLCNIFDNRFSINKNCLSIDKMLELQTVPVDCLYVTDKKKYKKERDRRHYKFSIKIMD
jgi:uncharacterized cysteine cluster protein YcgN (CxxCxxCC family)